MTLTASSRELKPLSFEGIESDEDERVPGSARSVGFTGRFKRTIQVAESGLYWETAAGCCDQMRERWGLP